MAPQDSPSFPLSSSSRWRLLAVFVLLAATFVFAQQSDFIDGLDPYAVREWVRQWGAFSALAFIALYTVGLLLFVPGTLFTVAGALLFGQLYGFFVVWIAANVAMSTSFFMVRLVGGQPLDQARYSLVRRMVSRLDNRPVQTVAVLRLFLFTAPALSAVLALSRVGGRDHVLGTLLGSIVPTATVVIMTDWLLSFVYTR